MLKPLISEVFQLNDCAVWMTTFYVGMICCTDEGADGIMIPLVLWLAAIIISAFAPAAALPGSRESFKGCFTLQPS